ncbi:hypothetical protein [Tichowtungia aerotolerans]|uniref:Alpha-L-arabinofuranosidase 1 catalytic domain-containing protein n=1 Tax=Tichowtungia aerotolerans TaxID=2697043 RepID=A0A6P1M8W5_9BACT|nr:hypothetical protein [Tichowtungia aerotolerans]QHI70337.1 hypothetical protein GT409_13090 [Tichowtungia aerotolerans]
MLKTVIILVCLMCWPAALFAAEPLIGWEGGRGTNTAIQVDGINGFLFTGKLYAVDSAVGSLDGTFGASIYGASTNPSAYNVRTVFLGEKNTVGIQIQNNTGGNLQLTSISFDYLAWFSNSPKTITLTYAYGDLDDPDNTVLQSVGGLGHDASWLSDYPDFDWTLENLSDYVLADGERATFELTATDAADENTSGAFDNIAVSGQRGNPPPFAAIETGVEKSEVTKMMSGAGLIYLWCPDAFYADGEIADIAKNVGIGALRWPGGTVVTVSHWDAFTGAWTDSWNPTYDIASGQPPENFMDLDEYLALIDQTGAEIMLGINMSSGKEWQRETEGVAEARALVQACKDRGYNVKYIYFDNESYHSGNGYNRDLDGDGESWTPASYAESFNLYAEAIKEVFPDAKLIANWINNVTGSAFQSAMETMLGIAGTNIDYVDIHWYWEWDNASWPLWKSELPMSRTSSSFSYKDSILYANNLFASLGYPNIRMVVLEWNLGPGPWQTDLAHSNFKTALMQTEMQMQFLQAGLDIGLIFALHNAPGGNPALENHVVRSGGSTSTALWMWLFSKAVGKTVVQASASIDGIYIVAVKGRQGELVAYLLNKTDSDRPIEFIIPGYQIDEIDEAWRFKDDGNGQGSLQKIGLWDVNGRKRTTLLANSLNMIGFNYLSNDVPNRPVIQVERTRAISESLLAGWHSAMGIGGDISAAGINALLWDSDSYGFDETVGSTDGSYGSADFGASSAAGAFVVRATNGMDEVGFQIENETGLPLCLEMVHFDYAPWWTSSPQDVALYYTFGNLSGVTNRTLINSVSGLSSSGNKLADYHDFDWSLSVLPDQVLEHGEKASFILRASNATEIWSNGAFDNIAVSGSTVSDASDSLVVSWRAETARKYTVVQSSSLLSNEWNTVSPIINGIPGDMSLSVLLESPGFYRLQVENP